MRRLAVVSGRPQVGVFGMETGIVATAIADKAELRRILEEQDFRAGFVVDPGATARKARELMEAQGVRPEDNSFSCEIRRAREGD